MVKNIHEIRDPIHVFVHLDSYERDVLNSHPFQRLRHIHQLALTYLVYPSATHKRFEHSLGVMELASRVFDVITNRENTTEEVRDVLRELVNDNALGYWRSVLRMAALCHDIGHLPFSHAAEGDLLPDGWDHERLTRELISSERMRAIWNEMMPPLRHEHIVKLAVGPKKASDLTFSKWETLLSEVIVGDAFGVDRMDYLLRDSHHTGVAYGKFDHYRLIDTLRILPAPQAEEGEEHQYPTLGVEDGGIQSAEALMLARYFMFSQVYLHPVRRIYDIHLKDFLKQWLQNGIFSTNLSEHLQMTDNEVTAGLLSAAYDSGRVAHCHARRVVRREHFKKIHGRNPKDVAVNPEAGKAIYDALAAEFGPEYFRHDRYGQKGGAHDFPVRQHDGRIVSSLSISENLKEVPVFSIDFVFADRAIYENAKIWVEPRREEIIRLAAEEVEDG